ncbi:hypothetical protein U1Q18_007646, partial [Sarracenia purpurea var. burkii]
NLGSYKDLCEDDLLILEKGTENILIKENLEPNQEESSNSEQITVQELPNDENVENPDFPKEWRYAHGHPKDLIIGNPS